MATTIPKYIVGIDVEALGPNVNFHHTSQIGFAILDTDTMNFAHRESVYIKMEVITKFTADQWTSEMLYTEGMIRKTNMDTMAPGHAEQMRKLAQETVIKDNTYMKNLEPNCYKNFWSERPLRYTETMACIQDPTKSLTEFKAMNYMTDVVRAWTNAKHSIFVTDTSAFDGAVLNTMFGPPRYDNDAMSLNYFFLNEKGQLVYRPVEQGDAFARGIGCLVESGSSNFMKACIALGVEAPVWDIKHDHHPENDAAVIALNHAFLLKTIESKKVKIT